MKNWKTTLGGVLLGLGMITAHVAPKDSAVSNVGIAASAIGAIFGGSAAKDSKKDE